MTSSNKLESGTIFGGTYRILDFIGEGGMGLVYKVEHLLLARVLALKILKTEYLTEAVWKRFRAEGQAIAKLDHSNIVRIYDMSQTEEGVPFYTMDLLIGDSLADHLQDYGPLKQEEALPIFRQVCAGLAYAHERGIIHRDIKPGNIMLIDSPDKIENDTTNVSKKRVKIVDFGIAKLTDERGNTIQGLTKPGEVFGSPLYMSPEQCNGQKVDQRSDLYSVGVTLFQALTGKPPLLGRTAIETTMMHQTTVPPILSEVSDELEFDPGLEAVVAKMLEKRPENRYSSLSEVALDLLRIERHDEPILPSGSKNTLGSSASELTDSQTENETTAERQIFSTTNIVALSAVVTMLAGAAIATAIIFQAQAGDKKKQAETIAAKLKEKEAANRATGIGNLPENPDPAKGQTKLVLIAAPVLDQFTKDKVEAYLKNNTTKFSSSNTVNNERVITFNFPKTFSLGTLNNKSANEKSLEVEAQNTITLSKANLRRLTANDILRAYPQLLSGFASNDLWTLTVAGQSADDALLIAGIAKLTDLVELNLTNTILPARQLTNLNSLTKLDVLRLSSSKLDDDGLSDCTFLKQVRILDLESCKNILPYLKQLKQSTALERLVLNRCTLSSEDVAALSEITCLQKLILSKSSITNDNLKQLTSLSSIKALNIEKCGYLDSECLSALKAWPKLKDLRVSKRLLSAEQVNELKASQRQRKIELTVEIDRM